MKKKISKRLFKKLRKGNLSEQEWAEMPSIEEMARYTAGGLVEMVWQRAFKLFRDKKFRKLANFGKISTTEQDRIFNELVVSGLALIMLTLEAPDLRVESELKDYFRNLKDEVPKAHIKGLKELGIEEEYLKTWRKLLDLRYDEYRNYRIKVRGAAMESYSQESPLTEKDLDEIQMTLPVRTLAMGSFSHISRGKGKPEDPLYKVLVKWLGKVYLSVRVRVEGGKITLWKKLKVKLRHLRNSLRGKN